MSCLGIPLEQCLYLLAPDRTEVLGAYLDGRPSHVEMRHIMEDGSAVVIRWGIGDAIALGKSMVAVGERLQTEAEMSIPADAHPAPPGVS